MNACEVFERVNGDMEEEEEEGGVNSEVHWNNKLQSAGSPELLSSLTTRRI